MQRRIPTWLSRGTLLGGLWLLSGCCQFAMVRCWEPPGVDMSGIRSVAVVDFTGPHGDELSAALTARLAASHSFTLVDPAELQADQHAICAEGTCDAGWIQRARERGVDAVLVGEVTEYRCDDELCEAAAGKRRTDISEGVTAAPQSALQREAVLTVSFRLLDARTGETRASQSTTHRYRQDSQSSGKPLLPRHEVLTQLADLCVEDFLADLTPHPQEAEMKLARGGWYGRGATEVRGGNRQAEAGDWDAARDHWQAAVDRNPECDAALYNLALDAAHRQQYERAEELAMQAIRLRHTENYAAGLERIRLYRSGFEAVREQRDSRVLQAAATGR